MVIVSHVILDTNSVENHVLFFSVIQTVNNLIQILNVLNALLGIIPKIIYAPLWILFVKLLMGLQALVQAVIQVMQFLIGDSACLVMKKTNILIVNKSRMKLVSNATIATIQTMEYADK